MAPLPARVRSALAQARRAPMAAEQIVEQMYYDATDTVSQITMGVAFANETNIPF